RRDLSRPSLHDALPIYSEAFRAPTFNDLYSPWGNNPDLNPEESKNVELLWRSRLSNGLHLETSIYRNAVDDLIVWSTNSLGQDIDRKSTRLNSSHVKSS